MTDLVARARVYAIQAHTRINHRRKYSMEPYEVHLKDVADIVSSVTDDQEMIAAAWLHDIVEDTPASFLDLEKEFGKSLADLVSELTDVSRPADGNRATRKAIDREHLAAASRKAKTVKLADLIDNCSDICKHDPKFAKVYLAEMAALLEILSDGDPTLHDRARKLLHNNAKVLDVTLATDEIPDIHTPPKSNFFSYDRPTSMFLQSFMARDIAQALPSVDFPPTVAALEIMAAHKVPALGVRHQGLITGYIIHEDPLSERPFRSDQLMDDNASFSEVVLMLSRHDLCFVRMLGNINGIITRDDLQHPFVRMWLFGIITMVEMQSVPIIEKLWPDNSWQHLVSEGRLEKAKVLLAEKERRSQKGSLLGCLQLSDKLQILIEHKSVLDDLGLVSKNSAKKICKEIESLRNNLAHAQDIVTHDFAQIARMAQRIEAARQS